VAPSPSLLDFCCPSLDPFALATHLHLRLDALHAFGIRQERMISHAASIRPFARRELQHGKQEFGNSLGLLDAEVVLLPQHIWESPVSEAVDVAQFSFTVEDFLRPLARHVEGFGEDA